MQQHMGLYVISCDVCARYKLSKRAEARSHREILRGNLCVGIGESVALVSGESVGSAR